MTWSSLQRVVVIVQVEAGETNDLQLTHDQVGSHKVSCGQSSGLQAGAPFEHLWVFRLGLRQPLLRYHRHASDACLPAPVGR